MIVEGRNDDQTWTGIPLKNICGAATRACLVLCFAISLENALSIFSPQFFPNSPFIALCGFLPPMLCFLLPYRFIACSVFNPVKKSEWSRWRVLPTSAKCGAQRRGLPLRRSTSLLSSPHFLVLKHRDTCRGEGTRATRP